MSEMRTKLLGILSDTVEEHEGTWVTHLEERVDEILVALGFTREDERIVRELAELAAIARRSILIAAGMAEANAQYAKRALLDVADKIEALLPPEGGRGMKTVEEATKALDEAMQRYFLAPTERNLRLAAKALVDEIDANIVAKYLDGENVGKPSEEA